MCKSAGSFLCCIRTITHASSELHTVLAFLRKQVLNPSVYTSFRGSCGQTPQFCQWFSYQDSCTSKLPETIRSYHQSAYSRRNCSSFSR